ncbi:hypothetical protein NliqN6_0147 [Naganishia liquefaciens]|uniref:LysM domain-containing protein n=1 Tax=Naganishia liquefaciens TaxID=104408 RepID=A0A8H3TNS4_9TREE|nr:hypothetical protein NliqN6_0147 [Naganishia liquefaciens]
MPALCLSCASTIHSHDTHKTPCCTAPICAACIARNPRIVGWVPCLQCGEGVGVVEALAKNRRGRRDDEEEEGLPAYEDVAGIDVGGDDDNDDDEPAHRGQVAVASEADALAQYHQIRRGETIRSIASHYSIDPHTLIKLNNLPHTALTTHPTVIQTRKQLRLTAGDAGEGLTNGWKGVEEDDPARAAERRAKRFQLITKTSDPAIAKAYLCLSDDEHPLLRASYADDGEIKEKSSGRSVAGITQEEAALRRWFEDEEWEARVGEAADGVGKAEAKGKGKGKGKGWLGGKGKGKGKSQGTWVTRGPAPRMGLGIGEKGVGWL